MQHRHMVQDPGHTHTDNGHSHKYDHPTPFPWSSGLVFLAQDNTKYLLEATLDTTPGFANLASSTTGLGVEEVTGVPAGALIGDEVRPKNMLVQFIIRIE